MQLKRSFCLLLALLCLLLCACKSGTGQDATANVDLQNEYVVILPDRASAEVGNAASLVLAALKAKGYNFKLKNDWLREGEQPGEFEILIGATNRPESGEVIATFKDDGDFEVKVIGKKIVVAGACGFATKRAAEQFSNAIKEMENSTIASTLSISGTCTQSEMLPTVAGVLATDIRTLYSGVTSVHYSLPENSKYGQQEITVVEFDPAQADLYFDVVGGGTYATSLKTVEDTTKAFATANPDKTPLCAINGDLWMVAYAHARVLGKGTNYNGYADAVVTGSLTVPRGFNMYNGEIITSTHTRLETPYEGDFYAFGVTPDGKAIFGNPQVDVSVTNTTKEETAKADGINRLPANNALILYSDAMSKNNALADAVQIVIDTDGYKLCHGASIHGTVVQIIPSGDETAPQFKEGRLVLTARGTKTAALENYTVGDTISLSISITDKMGNNAAWQSVQNAVGGHIPLIVDGASKNSKDTTAYPTSILGIKENGNVVMITYDGRQTGYATGVKISDADDLMKELGVITAFLLDGGGSATMVQNIDGTLRMVNRPCEKFEDGSFGAQRFVVNTVILSAGPKKEG